MFCAVVLALVSGFLYLAVADSSILEIHDSLFDLTEEITVAEPEFIYRDLMRENYRVLDSFSADITGDGLSDEVYLIERPFRDWPFAVWHEMETVISGNKDERGLSCSIFIFGPKSPNDTTGSLLWAGSPMFVPFTEIEPVDSDKDKVFEIAAIESDYTIWSTGFGTDLAVWRWDGFGFRRDCFCGEGSFLYDSLEIKKTSRILQVRVK